MGIGITSLTTIMAVLMLTSFALLSLLSADSDLFLSEKAAQAVKDYYGADCLAEEWWQGLNEALGAGEAEEAPRRLAAAGYALEDDEDGGYVARAVFPMGEKRRLEVAAAVTADGAASILSWQSAPIYEAKP